MSWVFDRVADIYDGTRTHQPTVSEAVTDRLLHGVGATTTTRFVEIGVGTGRLARPVAERGYDVFGFDLSRAMMQRARGVDRLHLCRADICQLPLPDACCDAVIAFHIFHLVPGWQSALAEVWRILRPGGCLAVGRDDYQGITPDIYAFSKQWCEAHDVPTTRPGIQNDPLHEHLLAEGLSWERTESVIWYRHDTLADRIEAVANRVNSHTWRMSDEDLARLVAAMTAWSIEQGADRQAPLVEEVRTYWDLWRRPGSLRSAARPSGGGS